MCNEAYDRIESNERIFDATSIYDCRNTEMRSIEWIAHNLNVIYLSEPISSWKWYRSNMIDACQRCK